MQNIDLVKQMSELNIRNWKMQSDLSTPLTLRYIFSLNKNTKIYNLFYFIFYKLINIKEEFFSKRNLKIDLKIIETVDATNLLKENPVHKTFGKTPWIFLEGVYVNPRWIRYIYLSHRIFQNKMLTDGGIWIDIGSFYGGLQSIVFSKHGNSKFIMVDFKHQLLRSYLFLSEMYPDAKHYFGENLDLNQVEAGSFTYVSVEDLHKLDGVKPELVTNFFSFGEMRREFFEKYINSKFMKNSTAIYTVNRVKSAPFFEKTYDSDLNILDYILPGFYVKYFDIFPIHHYSSVKRKFLNKNLYANISSPYFELVLINNRSENFI